MWAYVLKITAKIENPSIIIPSCSEVLANLPALKPNTINNKPDDLTRIV
jgi:hypothetical protein